VCSCVYNDVRVGVSGRARLSARNKYPARAPCIRTEARVDKPCMHVNPCTAPGQEERRDRERGYTLSDCLDLLLQPVCSRYPPRGIMIYRDWSSCTSATRLPCQRLWDVFTRLFSLAFTHHHNPQTPE
jgi:hypothetical protein